MLRTLLLLPLLTTLLATGCGGDDGSAPSPPGDTNADGTSGFDGTDQTGGTDSTGATDTTSGTEGTNPTDGTDGTEATDATDGPPGEDTVFQGTHQTLLTTPEGSETYSGKMGIKVRADGVFSGKGTGSGDVSGIPVELSVSGQVSGKSADGQLVWNWVGEDLDPVTMTASGTIAGGSLELTYKGGDPSLKFQGTMTLSEVPSQGP